MSDLDETEHHLVTQHSLKAEELSAQFTAVKARTLAIILIAPLITILTPWPGPVFSYILLVAFVLLGWGAWWVANASWGKQWHQYAFVSADFVLLTFTLLYPNPFVPLEFPPQFAFRFGSFIYFFVILAGLAYVYQPKLVLWGGITAAISWTLGALWLIRLPDTVWQQSEASSVDAVLKLLAQPTFIDVGVRIQEVVVFLIAAGLLALAVRRSRTIAKRQAKLAAERENLGRYFPRKTAQMLAEKADPFSVPSEHNCAVLFADLVAFTSWSEKHSPRETIELLRKVHGLLASIVFRNDGTLDKFIGDGIMATFGTPEPTSSDASNALNAMIEMVSEFEKQQANSEGHPGSKLKLAVGVHYGPVVLGNVGSNERLEFAVLGDTVNIASRLESATRQVGCCGLASAALVEAATNEGLLDASMYQDQLKPHGSLRLRGLANEMDVYKIN